MPFADADGARLYYRVDGREDRPAIVLAHSLGVDLAQWDPQVTDLLPHFRVLRLDMRGHGASDTTPGDYTMEQLARDVLAAADAAGLERFAFCGLSIGGMIGQWLAAKAPERLTHAVLANTTAKLFDPVAMEARRVKVLEGGMPAVADGVVQRFFSPENVVANPPFVATTRRTLLATNPVGYAGCCAAVRDLDQAGLLSTIEAPTLVIAGDRDLSTPWKGNGDLVAASIPGAKVVHLPTAHLSNLERPRSFTAALFDFLLPASSDDSLEVGMKTRRSVLGDDYVNRAIASSNQFNADFQQLITRYAWGAIWSRPGLDTRTRRLLAIAMTAALGRWEEFRLHVRAGLRHELELCDIKEALLQTAIYAGVPAANTGFKIVAEESSSGEN